MKSLKHVFGLCLSQKKGYHESSYTGMTKQGMTASSDEGDEVERSLQLLDRVLEEFDDLENANLGGAVPRTASSEDDGYMSLNGRRKPPIIDTPPPSAHEAQRIISNLLPRVSPSNSSKRGSRRGKLHTSLTLGHEDRYSTDEESRVPAATQTTVPKTRHQRPYGWQNGRVPPRTVASTTAAARHREVRRDVSPLPCEMPAPPEQQSEPLPSQTDLHPVAELSDANFSDDSLEGVPPPPPPRGSIAWEVPLDDEHALYTPGSTKVIGRRRRRSTDRSSTGSICRMREQDEWPDPPTGTEDGSISPLSDSSHLDSSIASKHEDALPPDLSGTDMSSGGTYVVRKPRQRKQLPLPEEALNGEKRTSTTFDNIKSLLREGLIEGLDEAPPDFPPPTPPNMVRVVSLPAFPSDKERPPSEENKKEDKFSELGPTVEEDEDSQSSAKCDIGIQVTPESSKEPVNSESTDSESERKRESSVVILNGTDTSSNEALMRELKKTYDTESINNNIELNTKLETARVEELEDPWLTAAEISQVQVIPVVTGSPEKPPKEFKVKVEVLQHEFGPLPPSPVEEVDEYSDVLRSSPKQNSRCKPDRKESFYRCSEPAGSDPLGSRFQSRPESSGQQHGTSSLKTRSMDAGFSRNHRSHQSATSRSKDGVGERRTLPCELQGPRRRTYQKRTEPHMQVSCSLPETPIFARGCDIPRTPHRKAPDVPSTAPRSNPQQQSNTSTYRSTGMSLGEAMAGAELLRLAGGPGRGWYPRHRHPRPASVEHLDRIPHPWAPHDHRKPQTLPPNLTPKFFHKSPRDALRRVTSLLIRKGNSKDKKDVLSPTSGLAEGSDTARQKKGFFRSWWKKSRHYSLDQQATGQQEQ